MSLACVALAVACGGDRSPAAPADAGISPLEKTPPAPVSAERRKDQRSSPVVFDPLRGGVWTANGDVGTISYVDVDGAKRVAELAIGKDVRSVALSPDARWIAAIDWEGASVTLVDPDARRVVRTIALGTHPHGAIWDAWDPRWLYVTLEDESSVAIVDRTAGSLVARVPVGRLPAGLSVSRSRHELYVTHRIDPFVTRMSLESGNAQSNVTLADEPPNDDPTVPQGRPFAFEGAALSADGNLLWVPHELFANVHPFQFKETVFPAVSVLDFSGVGAEVLTDPADPNGAIAGRKLLFSGINIPDATGATSVVSEPCAVATHPNGFVAYVLACGSEDLITFDVIQGISVDLLRNLPGDHPTGIALDDTGQRAFVVSDQSHTLLRLNLARGNLTEHVRWYGDPISLVAEDPVDPDTRAGLTLFHRANGSKGAFATTGNDWLSCAACHLDGFGSGNQVFFDALSSADPAVDARIGHTGLADLFSTAPTPQDGSFNPHDILVAFAEMGGLSPDRSGENRDGATDPLSPPPDMATAAAQVARVVARDLPQGPSWLLPGGAPNTAYDGAWCGKCHAAEYDAWKESAHSRSSADPMVRFCVGVEQKLQGNQYSRLCAGCHDPVSARAGDFSLSTDRSVTCLGCHDITRTIRAGGNADLGATTSDWQADHKARATESLTLLRSPEFCGGCHQQFVPGSGLPAIGTLDEWRKGPYGTASTPTACVDCHMQKANGIADHRTIGGNVYLAAHFGDSKMEGELRSRLTSTLGITASADGSGQVRVELRNVLSGHHFPTGVSDLREAWVELRAMDGSGKTLATFGGVDPSGVLPAGAARLGMDVAKEDGTLLLQHELSIATKIPFDRRVPAGGSLVLSLPSPASPPNGTAEIDAVLLYHNVRTTYFRAATGDGTGSAPTIELGRAKVQ